MKETNDKIQLKALREEVNFRSANHTVLEQFLHDLFNRKNLTFFNVIDINIQNNVRPVLKRIHSIAGKQFLILEVSSPHSLVSTECFYDLLHLLANYPTLNIYLEERRTFPKTKTSNFIVYQKISIYE